MAEENNANESGGSFWGNLVSGAGSLLSKGVDTALDIVGNKYSTPAKTTAANSTAPASGVSTTKSTPSQSGGGLSTPLIIGGAVAGVAVVGTLIYLIARK